MGMGARSATVAAVAALMGPVLACNTAPAPLGEALVVVQTDVAVPRRVSRVRVEVFAADGRIVERRDVVTPTTDDWPVSFSVVLPEDATAEQDVLVRLRAYPEGHELAARDLERLARAPARNVTVHPTIEEACKNPPVLRIGVPLTLRRGSTRITQLLGAQGCSQETVSGSAVARLEIAEQGSYRVEIQRSVPNGAVNEPGSDTAISLRTSCTFSTTQIACAENPSVNNRLSRVDATLAPGVYFVVTGGGQAAPADLTLLASRLDAFTPVVDPPDPPLISDPLAMDPMPGVTIDRLVALRVRPGERGRADVTLHGECFGTPADLTARTSCIAEASKLLPIVPTIPASPLVLDAVPPPRWPADEPAPCTVSARPDEVCVPGGTFVLGDTLALEDLDRRAQPERMRVVERFLLDRFEMSVGKLREALKNGFDASSVVMPVPNDQPGLAIGGDRMCTWSTIDVGREAYPLVCVPWGTARAICHFFGGDLPTEDQWEYAATAAGRDAETPYPWGRDLPTCERTVYGRTQDPTFACPSAPLGPIAVNDPLLVLGDVTPLGIVGLGGNVEELLATAFVPYSDSSWHRAGLRAPLEEPEAPLRSARGADWSVNGLYATASTRRSEPPIARYNNVGFRCARRGR